MTDEAHGSQYKMLGVNLDKGIPNAAKIGYTGTPIDKTERVFGDYIDKYTMRQAIDDGVTLEIVYEGRTHNAEVAGQVGMDQAFADVFSDYNLQERLEILGYWFRDAYLEKADIQKILLQPAYAGLPNLLLKRAQIISRVMDIAEKNNDVILYAE